MAQMTTDQLAADGADETQMGLAADGAQMTTDHLAADGAGETQMGLAADGADDHGVIWPQMAQVKHRWVWPQMAQMTTESFGRRWRR
jgi:hypothetical protein